MNQKHENIKISFEVKYLVILITYALIISYMMERSLASGLIFIAYQICFLLVPGALILKLIDWEISNTIEKFAFIYCGGYAFQLLAYLFVVPLHMQKYALWITIILIVVLTIVTVKIRKLQFSNWKEWFLTKDIQLEFNNRKGQMVCLITLALVLTLQLFTYVANNQLPPVVEETTLFNDCVYWMGNTVELTKHFPPYDFRNYPNAYNYHYFSSVQIALMHLITGIRISVLSFGFTVIQSMTMCVMTAYALFYRLTSKETLRILGLLLIFVASGVEDTTIVYYYGHMYVGQFGFDYGLGFFLFLLLLIYRLYQDKKPKLKDLALIWLVFLVDCGLKASFGSMGLVLIGLLCVFWLFGKERKKAYIVGLPILAIFVVVYIFITNFKGYGGGNFFQLFQNGTMYENRGQVMDLLISCRMILHNAVLGEIVFNVYYWIMCNPMIYILVGYIFLKRLITRKWIDRLSICILLTMVVCNLIAMYMFMYGASNMYFMLASYPLGAMFILHNIDGEKMDRRKWYWIPILLLLVVSAQGFYTYYPYSPNKTISYGIRNMTDRSHVEYGEPYLNRGTFEAYEYVRQHTDIAQNTFITTNQGNNSTTVAGVFTECYYMECGLAGLTADSTQTDIEAVISTMKEKNIRFFLRYNDRQQDVDYDKVFGEYQCFSNADITIYQFD